MQEVIEGVEGLREESYKKGDIIFAEGKRGNVVYILKDGSVAVSALGSELCKLNTPGTILGEMSALLEGDYSATVTANSDTTFYVIENLFELFENKPEICMKVARLLALRLQNMNLLYGEMKHEIEVLQNDSSTKQASSRLYGLILKMDQFLSKNIKKK